jgi:tetratricopeptide (TPR) repeat protein
MAAARALSAQRPPDYKGALTAMSRAVKRAPQNNAELIREMLALLHRAGETKELLRMTGEFTAAGRSDWWIHQHRGLAKAAEKDVAGAVAEFDKALADADRQQNEKAAEAVVQSMASSLGADQALERATARASSDPRWKAVVATLYQTKSDWTNAVRQADELMAALGGPQAAKMDVKSKLTSLRTAAGIYHFAQPKPQIDKAQAAYLRILQEQPGDYFALNNLAVLLAEDASPPNPHEARKYSERAYDLVRRAQPMVSRVVDTHGWILTLTGEVDEGLPLLRSVVDNDPFAEARYHLGEAYLRKNRGEEAEQQLVAAREELLLARQQEQEVDAKLVRKVDDALTRARALRNEAKAQ